MRMTNYILFLPSRISGRLIVSSFAGRSRVTNCFCNPPATSYSINSLISSIAVTNMYTIMIISFYIWKRCNTHNQNYDHIFQLLVHQTQPLELSHHSLMFRITAWFSQIMTYLFQGLFKDFWGTFSRSFQGLFFVVSNIHSQKIINNGLFK